MAILSILTALSVVGSVVGIGVDWYWSSRLEDGASQLSELISMFEHGMDFDTFVSDCWLFIILGFASVCFFILLAFPKKKKVIE